MKLFGNFVDQKYVYDGSSKFKKRTNSNPAKVEWNALCAEKSDAGCQPTPQNNIFRRTKKDKSVYQFTAIFDESDDPWNDKGDCVADAVNNIIAYFIQIESAKDVFPTSFVDADDVRNTLSHIATTQDELETAALTARLRNISFTYSVSPKFPRLHFATKFDGNMVDTGAARGCSSGIVQCQAYCHFAGQEQQIFNTMAAVCYLGIGAARSKGVVSISFSIGSVWFSFNVHAVDADTSLLLSVDHGWNGNLSR